MIKKKICIILSIVLCLVSLAGCGAKETGYSFKYWNDNPSLQALVDYVNDVTNEKSENFIPLEDRIAVFDMDGTLYCETAPTYIENILLYDAIFNNPTLSFPEEITDLVLGFKEAVDTNTYFDEFLFTKLSTAIYAGMSLDEYDAYVKDYVENTDAPGFKGLKYADAFYLPMVEVVDYLNANDFSIYLCSGTDRGTCRALLDGHVNIPSQNIIGCDVKYIASGQGDLKGHEYVFNENDRVVRSNLSYGGNIKADKVSILSQTLGKQPVLAFGNSDGDESMMIYTTCNNKYKTAGFMVLPDDTVRENGNTKKAADRKALWDSYGWYSFSMKDDFKTIYGDNVSR